MQRVISLWLPRFATDRRRRSRGDGESGEARPLTLVAETAGRLELTAVDEAAALAGLAPGMTLAAARAFLPALRTAPAALEADRAALRRVAEWAGRYSPWTAPEPGRGEGGAAGIVLDVTGCAHLFGGEKALLDDLIARLSRQGFTAYAGLAETPGAAWAAARFTTHAAAPTRIVPPGELRDFLQPLPPTALRLPPAAAETLGRLGITRVAQLMDIDPAGLSRRFGEVVGRRLEQALGESGEPISPLRPVPPALERLIFAEPIAAPEDIARAVEKLAAGLTRRLEATGMGARRLDLCLYRVDGSVARQTLGASRATRDPAHIRRLFAGHLERIDPGFGIEVMTLAAGVAEPLSALQMSLRHARRGGAKSAQKDHADGLPALLDRLTARLGEGCARRPEPRESHLPERCERRVAPTANVSAAPTPTASTSWPRTPPRPLRLFDRPQPVEVLFGSGAPDLPPARFRWRRLTHDVVRAEGPERIEPEWWRDAGESAPARDYFRIETGDGRRYWLYRASERWYLHGLFA